VKSIQSAFSHLNLLKKKDKTREADWSKRLPLAEIRSSEPMEVETYDELVQNVAQIQYRNRAYAVYFRGQDKEYLSKEGSSILPTIYRLGKCEKRLSLKKRFKNLEAQRENCLSSFEKGIKLAGISQLKRFIEVRDSLLQHYGVCATPLLDITQSLHVACSFAFDCKKTERGIIYVLGLPWQTDTITYTTHEEIVNIRLLSIAPPTALRPYFQEGFLCGPFPYHDIEKPERKTQFDFGRRLLAKFSIPLNYNFWGVGFSQIPRDKLYQSEDEIAKRLPVKKKECDDQDGTRY
jgi:hypothetical protein